MSKRIAIIGDVHGRSDLLKDLYNKLCWQSLDAIRHSGDLVDRGPDSGGVVQFCREKGIQGVLGNHEQSLITYILKDGIPKNPEKRKTLSQLGPEDKQYILDLPLIHVDDSIGLVSVHGGVWPGLPWHAQPTNICRAQMIHPKYPGSTRWFSLTREDIPETQLVADGWRRWYHLYDHEYHVVYGHSVFQSGPYMHRNPGSGYTIGVDTGAVWGGRLSAVIMPDLFVVSTLLDRHFTFNEVIPDTTVIINGLE